jgi:hypothetical protein
MYEKQVLDYQNGYWSWIVITLIAHPNWMGSIKRGVHSSKRIPPKEAARLRTSGETFGIVLPDRPTIFPRAFRPSLAP